MNHMSMVLMKVLQERFKAQMDTFITDEQAGFQKDRNIIHLILILRLVAEKAYHKGKQTYHCFIDFQKAFNTIRHYVIWVTLKSYGVRRKLIALMKSIVENAQAARRVGKELGEWFGIGRWIGRARGVMSEFKNIWKSKSISIKTNQDIMVTCVISVVLYAYETWTLKKKDKNKLMAFEMRCYRRIPNIRWQ